MALHLRAKRPLVQTKLIGALVAIGALLLQPFGAIPLPVAKAAGSSDVWIKAAMPNPVNDDSKGEYIVFENKTATTINLAGWTISDNSSVFTLSGTLTGGASYKLCAESDDTSTALPCDGEWSSMSLLNSGGETLTLREGTTIIDQVAYTSVLEGTPIMFVSHTAPSASVTQNTVCNTGCEWTTIADAVAGEAAESMITIKADSPKIVNSTVLVNKKLTIVGEAGAKIQTSGSNMVFTTTAAGVVISNLAFEKTDKVNQELINVQGANTTISNNTFKGQYTTDANDHTSRALAISTTANLTLSGNTFNNLRQPAYINNGATGSITNNYVNQTRGWVVEKASDFSFSDNTWGANVLDIAIIPGVNPAGTSNTYTCRLTQLRTDNSNANIEDQYPADYCPITPGVSVEQKVSGSTTTTENEAGKWWFNRDTNTATPYFFTGAQESTGTGSLFVPAIGSNASDKFIGEYYVANKLDDTGAISFDYRLADGVAASKANHVYMNLYVNYSNTANYGDCVYSIAATNGAAGWHTVSFTANGTYDVRTRPSAAPNVCPAKPSDLPATAYVRAFSLNLGDTSANDVGVSAHLDNVRVEKVSQTSVYDFEPDTTKPIVNLIAPTAGALNPTQIIVDASDDQVLNRVTANVRNSANAIVLSCSPSANGAKSYRMTCAIPGTLADGQYSVRYNASDATSNVSSTGTVNFSVDRSAPDVSIVSPSKGAAVRGAVTVRGEVADANPQTSYLRITGPGGYVASSYHADGRAAHEYAWNTAGLTDGTYTIRFEARDAAGNKDAGSVQDIQVFIDNTKGSTVINTPTESSVYSADFSLSVTSKDGGSGIVRGVANLYRADGTLVRSCYNQMVSPAQASQDFSCNIDVDILADGNYYLRVNASDRAGNVTNTVTRSFTVDTTAPVATVVSPAEGQSVSTDDENGKLVIGGSFTDNQNRNYLQIELVRAGNLVAVNTVHGSQFTGDDYTTEFDVSRQPNGQYSIFYTATDMAGNVSERFERTFTLNNQGTPIVLTPVVEEEPVTGTPINNGTPTGNNTASSNTPATTPVSPFVAALNNAAQPAALATTFIAAVNNASDSTAQTPSEIIGEVLGTTTTEADEDGEVAGASDKASWSLADMAWYWWVIGVLGAMGLWLMIAAASRRIRGVES